MYKYIFLTVCLLILSSSFAMAENYTFTDETYTAVEDYQWYSSPAAVSSNSITVSGTTGKITDLNVSINGINSDGLIDMTLVLVSPDNTAIVLASNAGGGGSTRLASLNNISLTFDDEANKTIKYANSYNQALKTSVDEGSYQTSVYTHPSWHYWNGSYATADPVGDGIFGSNIEFAEENLLSAFDDISANGDWLLLAYDNLVNDLFTFSGWSISFETTGGGSSAVAEPAEWALIAICLFAAAGFRFYQNKNTAA